MRVEVFLTFSSIIHIGVVCVLIFFSFLKTNEKQSIKREKKFTYNLKSKKRTYSLWEICICVYTIIHTTYYLLWVLLNCIYTCVFCSCDVFVLYTTRFSISGYYTNVKGLNCNYYNKGSSYHIHAVDWKNVFYFIV